MTNGTVSLRKRHYVNFFGAASALTAECRISGTYPDDPAVENLLYNVG
ncbi:MAG: hypothetical protein KUG57_05615 [Ilumatobacteraceae bacterium]|nr:hypothetical protein [Ilumatobacteraceae bacterium]